MDDRARFLATCDVSHETLRDLDAYASLLAKWQTSINLVGQKTMAVLWSRHILDCYQIVSLIPDSCETLVDLGSGGGLPGLIIAIAMKERRRGHVTLVESNGKKASFLRIVAQSLNLPVTVRQQRIEDVTSTLGSVDVVTARALAELRQLLDWSAPLLKTGAMGLFHKGRDLDKEIAEAAISWHFTCARVPSVVESGSWIVQVTDLSPRSQVQQPRAGLS